MKPTVFSFPFFVYLCLLYSCHIFSQNVSIDSFEYYNEVAETPKNENDLQNAYDYFLKYQELALNNEDRNAVIFSYLKLSTIEYNVGLYWESQATAVKAVSIMDSLVPIPYFETLKPTLYNQIARVYQALNNYSDAEEYYKKSLPYAKSPTDSLIIYNNLGNIYLEQGNYPKSKSYLELARKLEPKVIDSKVTDSIEIARVWANFGYVEHKLNPGEGLGFLNKALEARKQVSDLEGIYDSYKLLSNYYSDLKELEVSKSYADTAYSVAKKLKSLSFIEDALRQLALLDSGDIKKYFQVSDSLKKITRESQNWFAYRKYNFEKATRESLENSLKAEKERTKSILLLSGIILLTILGTWYFKWLKDKNKKARILDIYNTETRISKKVHDELANDQYQVMSLLEVKGTDPEIINRMENIYMKTRDISKSISDVDVKNNFAGLLKDLLLSYNNSSTSVIAKNIESIDWNKVLEARKQAIFRIIQELLTNMKKHSKASNAVFIFKLSGSKINIQYKDNGIGCELTKKSGLQSVENRIETLNGHITFESEPDKGFKVSITI